MKHSMLCAFFIGCISSAQGMELSQTKKEMVSPMGNTHKTVEKLSVHNKKCCQRPTELAKKVLNNPIIILPVATRILGSIAKILLSR